MRHIIVKVVICISLLGNWAEKLGANPIHADLLEAAIANFEGYDSSNLLTGFEVEGVIPRNINFFDVAEYIVEILRSNPNIVVNEVRGSLRAGYMIIMFTHSKEGAGNWCLVDDPSIDNENTVNRRMEIITPPFRPGSELAKIFRKVIRSLKTLGFESAPRSGIHYHAGFPPNTAAVVVALAAYIKIESALYRLEGVSRTRLDFAAKLPKLLLSDLKRGTVDLNQSISQFVARYFPERYFEFNPHPLLGKPHTIEYRFPNSTVNIKRIFDMHNFLYRLATAVVEKRPSLMSILKENASKKIPIPRLAKVIGISNSNLVRKSASCETLFQRYKKLTR